MSVEDKLNNLKDEFCKWYCKYKDKTIEIEVNESGEYEGQTFCPECEELVDYYYTVDIHGRFNPCNYCQADNYIKHIRDEDLS